jgi:protein O-mannosyl-transferase
MPVVGILAAIVLATWVVYSPAKRGGLIWDDEFNLTKPELQSFDGLYRIWFDPRATAVDMQYYPLVHTVFWIEHRLWGDSFLGYHLINVLWHSVAIVLVYLLVERLKIPGALLAAAIFALHPVMVESVAWMTEQKNTLSTVLYLSAMLMYLRFDESRRRSPYFLALLLFAGAILSKTVTVTLPFALLVLVWWRRGTLSWRRDVLPSLPFMALGVAAGLMTIWVETTLVGAEGAEYNLTFLQRFVLAGRIIWFYLAKLAWPGNLTFTYMRWQIDPTQWWQWTFSIAALAATIAFWLMRKRWRDPLTVWLLFCGTLSPVLGFVNVYMFRYTYVADHLQYLASLAIIVGVAAGINLGLARLSLPMRRSCVALCILAIGMLAILSWWQSHLYANVVNLYQQTLEHNPGSWMAHNNLGQILVEEGNLTSAIEHFRKAIALNPQNAAAHNNLGVALANQGQLQEAVERSQMAVSLKKNDADFLNNLANALVRSKRFEEARVAAEQSVHLRPNFAEAQYNLGLALAGAGDLPRAIAHLEQAANLRPDVAEIRYKLNELRRQAAPQQSIQTQ